MSYRVRYTMPDGRTGHWMRNYATREEAQKAIDDRHGDTGLAYTVEEWPDVSTAAVPDASPDPTASQWPGQPAPEKPTSTTERLVGLLRDRHARGRAKYGTTLDRTDLTPEQWAQHAIEEAVDLAGYLMRLKDGFATQHGSTAEHHVEILQERIKELEALVEERGRAVTDAHAANFAMYRHLEFALCIGDAMRDAMRTGEWRAGHDRSMASSAMAGWDRWKGSLAKASSVPVGASEVPGEGGHSDRRRLEVSP